ncbi:MAG: rRNA maturation RNase YbeY [Candidatus Goldbacteria bacterium]|nr:rRNA maturation RNase YbeY [Candidatus Goldiibacteriota bacterium]
MKSNSGIKVFYKKQIKAGFDVLNAAEKIALAEKKPDIQANIVFVSDAFIKEMNLNYRMKNSKTDVISFENGSGGDIYISVDTAKTDAAELGITLSEEILRLLIHGLLHIMGYDHIKYNDYKKMYVKEKKYLEFFKKKGV